jgi:hypothetical protein
MDKEKLKEIIGKYIMGYYVNDMANDIIQAGFTRREKAKLVAPTYIQGRKFDKVFHCTACNGIPYGGVGDDSHFCMVCGAEIEEIVGL